MTNVGTQRAYLLMISRTRMHAARNNITILTCSIITIDLLGSIFFSQFLSWNKQIILGLHEISTIGKLLFTQLQPGATLYHPQKEHYYAWLLGLYEEDFNLSLSLAELWYRKNISLPCSLFVEWMFMNPWGWKIKEYACDILFTPTIKTSHLYIISQCIVFSINYQWVSKKIPIL